MNENQPVGRKTHAYVMQRSDIEGAADCIAKAFCGTTVNGIEVIEPVITALNITYDELYNFTKDYSQKIVDDELCVVIKDEDGTVVAAIIAEYLSDEEPDTEGMSDKFIGVMELVEYLDNKFRATELSKKGQWAHGFLIGSTLEASQNNYTAQMFELLANQIKKTGCVGIIGEVTNPYSLFMAKRMGAQELKEAFLSYKDFEVDGQKIFESIDTSEGCQLIYYTV